MPLKFTATVSSQACGVARNWQCLQDRALQSLGNRHLQGEDPRRQGSQFLLSVLWLYSSGYKDRNNPQGLKSLPVCPRKFLPAAADLTDCRVSPG